MQREQPEVSADARSSDARERAASALRRLGHALVSHDADAALLDRIAELAGRTAETVEGGTPRTRPIEAIKRRLWESPPADGAPMMHFSECVVSGPANPMGIALAVRRQGEVAVADVNLGPAFEGAPQRAHGGIIAAIFDDVMGYVLQFTRTPAYTGRLTVHYRAPVPIGEDLTVRGWLEARNGRKLALRAELHARSLLCEAEALFIAVAPERLGIDQPGGTPEGTSGGASATAESED